jgi:uncharacterized membrane protein
MNEIANNNTSSIAKVNYILQIVSTLIGITGIIAVIIAYVNKDDTDDWLQTHYRFQIRTFWIGTLYIMLGLFLHQVIIGYIILLFTFFWFIIRCAKGLKQLENNEPVKNVESWLFS